MTANSDVGTVFCFFYFSNTGSCRFNLS